MNEHHSLEEALAKGIDVSFDTGIVNWELVKKDGYSFGIIKAGGGSDISDTDVLFEVNMTNAKAAGIDCGAYWAASATTEDGIKKEAETFHSVIKDIPFEYPLYVDLTDKAYESLTTEELSTIIRTFCSYFEDMKYYIGIRCTEDFLNNYVDPALFVDYDVWLIDQDGTSDFGYGYGLWQYSSGSVNGVSGECSIDCAYKSFPVIMDRYNLNGYGK